MKNEAPWIRCSVRIGARIEYEGGAANFINTTVRVKCVRNYIIVACIEGGESKAAARKNGPKKGREGSQLGLTVRA